MSRASEIEVAKSLHDLSKTMSLSEATHEVHMSQPLCASYISKVALYVENFSGAGELIDYLDEFTKAMGCSSLSLGKDFMTALADLQIKSTQTTMPFCRLAIWLALTLRSSMELPNTYNHRIHNNSEKMPIWQTWRR